MIDVANQLMMQWQQQSLFEVVAFVLAVVYVWLASEENRWCWLAGLTSTALYAYVYFNVELIFHTLLNIYYILMAILGFIAWSGKGQAKLNITSMSASQHLLMVSIGILISFIVLNIATKWLDYDLLMLDISLTVFSIMTTILAVAKKLENWIYWTLINTTSVFLLVEKQLYLTVVLMIIYIVIAVKGYIQWRNKLKLAERDEVFA